MIGHHDAAIEKRIVMSCYYGSKISGPQQREA